MISRLSSAALIACLAFSQMRQNPSPMKDSTRAHQRLIQRPIPGSRHQLPLGELLLPERLPKGPWLPLIIHFHGAGWVAQQAVRGHHRNTALLTVALGSGSSVYAKPFQSREAFPNLLREAEAAAGRSLRPISLSGFSAGYGAIREILRSHSGLIDTVLLMDGLHASYEPEGKPAPLAASSLDVFVNFAREAAAGGKRMLVTHSEVFPGTFASTTETADYLVEQLALKRKPVVRWGPLGMQQLSEVKRGRFAILGFAGNSAPDHIDHLHAMGQWLRELK